ncbi:MAG: sterol desaturase family protein [Fimbriimonadaceae bacterium]|nr:sterol desaturase family protein [Chitinophagales bacterium]
MVEAVNYIVLAIPVFFLLIGIEILIDKLQHTGYYRMNDAISNLNAGITEQITGAFLKLFVVGIYIFCYEQLRFATIPSNIFTWIILFIGVDFFYYWFHRFAHEINFLWGGHVVHHQSEEYNLSVALRQGAFQKFGSFIFYLPLAFIGFDPVMFIVVSQVQTLYQFWIHTKTINKLPAPIEFVFNTPSHHRVHHGRNPKYIDRNHGGTLIIWDRMFGTFQKEEEEVVYGITKPLNTWNPLRAQIDFWKILFADVSKTRSFSDKIKLLTNPPGWYPAELGGPVVAPEITIPTADKYDISIPVKLNYYIFAQFLFILGITSYFLFSFDNFDLITKVIFAGFVIFSISSIGGNLEIKKWAFICEVIRLIATPVFFFYLIQKNYFAPDQIYFLYITAVISFLSCIIYFSFRKNFTS